MSKKTKIPRAPDFAAIEAGAAATAAERTRLLSLIGNLVFAWSNNESVFIYLIQILLDVDFPSAAVVFATLNSSRARLDLARRLAKMKIKDQATVRTLEKLIERFDACTKVRNEINHSIFQVNESGQITHANVLRVKETKTSVEYAEIRVIDAKRIKEIETTLKKLTALNHELWAFLPELEKKLAASTQSG